MNRLSLVMGAAGIALIAPFEGRAQPITLEGLADRIEALESENAALRAQVAELVRDRQTPAPAPPEPPGAPPPPPPAWPEDTAASAPPDRDLWDRAYAGSSVGVSRMSVIPSNIGFGPPPALKNDDTTLLTGLQIGRRWQSGHLVIGTEVGVDLARHRLVFGRDQGSPVFEYFFDTRQAFRVAGQVGLARGPWLLYGLGGVQFTDMKIRRYSRAFPNPGPVLFDVTREYTTDLFYGLGLATQIGPDVSVELEASRFQRSDIRYFGLNFTFPDSDSLRIRFNYLFP